MITWLSCAYILWCALSKKGYEAGIQVKTSDDSNDLILRIHTIYSFLPEHLKNMVQVNPSKKGKHLENLFKVDSNLSTVKGFNQGIEQVRSKALSLYLGDEFQLLKDSDGALASFQPTIDGGGQAILIGTVANRNLTWRKLAKKPSFAKKVSQGIHKWTNENGFEVIEIHYSADPEKDAEWVQRTRAKYLDKPWIWEQEYEINWESQYRSNNKFPLFSLNKEKYLSPNVLYNPNIPLVRGWDFGFSPSFHVCMLGQFYELSINNIKYGWQLKIIKTFIKGEVSSEKFITEMLTELSSLHAPPKTYEIIDISGTHNTHKGLSELNIFYKFGVSNILTKYLTDYDKEKLITDSLMIYPTKEPRILINPDDEGNQILIDALDSMAIIKGDHKIDAPHPYIDAFDAFTYILGSTIDPEGNPLSDFFGNKIAIENENFGWDGVIKKMDRSDKPEFISW